MGTKITFQIQFRNPKDRSKIATFNVPLSRKLSKEIKAFMDTQYEKGWKHMPTLLILENEQLKSRIEQAKKLLQENDLLGINAEQAELFMRLWKQFTKKQQHGKSADIAKTFMSTYGKRIFNPDRFY